MPAPWLRDSSIREAASWSSRPRVLLLPVYLFDHELIVPEGKPIDGPGSSGGFWFWPLNWSCAGRVCEYYADIRRFLGGFRSSRRQRQVPRRRRRRLRAGGGDDPCGTSSSSFLGFVSGLTRGLHWLDRRRHLVTGFVLATMVGIIALDVRGYSFTARRLRPGRCLRPAWRSPWPWSCTARSRNPLAATPGGGPSPIVRGRWH